MAKNGTAISSWSVNHQLLKYTWLLAAKVGCDREDSAEALECLRRKPSRELLFTTTTRLPPYATRRPRRPPPGAPGTRRPPPPATLPPEPKPEPGPRAYDRFPGDSRDYSTELRVTMAPEPGPRAYDRFPGDSRDYSTELRVTMAVGACLLFLNILAFAALYYKRDLRPELRCRRLSPHGGSGSGVPDGGPLLPAAGRELPAEEELVSLQLKRGRGVGAEPAEALRPACPPVYTMALRRAPDNLPLPSLIRAKLL
ncbi:hypothetical protein EI555_011159, partial [Monodon monoceros]